VMLTSTNLTALENAAIIPRANTPEIKPGKTKARGKLNFAPVANRNRLYKRSPIKRRASDKEMIVVS